MTLESLSDGEIAERSLENPEHFAVLINRYESKLLAYIRRISSFSYEEAEDILQEIFLSAWRNLNDFDTNVKFSSWIYRIAHNKTISTFRKNKKYEKAEISDELFDNLSSNLDIPEDLNKKINSEIAHKILLLLSDQHKEVLVLKFLEEKNYEEISDILKKPMGTVATLISRAKKAFLETYKRQYE